MSRVRIHETWKKNFHSFSEFRKAKCNSFLPVCLQDSPLRSVNMSCVPGWPKLSFWCHWRNMGRQDDPSNNSSVLMRPGNRHWIPNSNLKSREISRAFFEKLEVTTTAHLVWGNKKSNKSRKQKPRKQGKGVFTGQTEKQCVGYNHHKKKSPKHAWKPLFQG